jgi:hypothetical protein
LRKEYFTQKDVRQQLKAIGKIHEEVVFCERSKAKEAKVTS